MTRAEGAVEASVIVPVSRPDYGRVWQQVRQLERQLTERAFEIILADSSGCWSEQPWEAEASRTRVVAASATRGAGFARNVAAQSARGKFLLFCDADDLVAPDWLEQHMSTLATSPMTAGRSCRVDRDSREWLDGLRGFWPEQICGAEMGHHEGAPIASSANLGIEAAVFRRVGGFPVRYLRSQDVALSLALKAIGVVPTFVPGATVLKLQNHRTRREQWTVNFRQGRSRVRLHREFESGPPPSMLLLRSVARTLRSVATPRPKAAARFSSQLAQLCGVTLELARVEPGGGRWRPRRVGRAHSGRSKADFRSARAAARRRRTTLVGRLTGLLLRIGVACRDARRASVLVYSDTKVGSTSVERWIPAASGRRTVKLHNLASPPSVPKLLVRTLQEGKPSATSWNAHVMRARLALDRSRNPWQVVTLVRDPVARAVSNYFYFLADNGDAGSFDDSDDIDLEELSVGLIPRLTDIMRGDWFTDQFLRVTGIDVYEVPFPSGQGGQRIHKGRFEVLVLRCEDLEQTGARALSEFLSISDGPGIGRHRPGVQRGYGPIYQRFLDEARFPEGFLDHAYSQKYARHFYTESEIEAFRCRWLG